MKFTQFVKEYLVKNKDSGLTYREAMKDDGVRCAYKQFEADLCKAGIVRETEERPVAKRKYVKKPKVIEENITINENAPVVAPAQPQRQPSAPAKIGYAPPPRTAPPRQVQPQQARVPSEDPFYQANPLLAQRAEEAIKQYNEMMGKKTAEELPAPVEQAPLRQKKTVTINPETDVYAEPAERIVPQDGAAKPKRTPLPSSADPGAISIGVDSPTPNNKWISQIGPQPAPPDYQPPKAYTRPSLSRPGRRIGADARPDINLHSHSRRRAKFDPLTDTRDDAPFSDRTLSEPQQAAAPYYRLPMRIWDRAGEERYEQDAVGPLGGPLPLDPPSPPPAETRVVEYRPPPPQETPEGPPGPEPETNLSGVVTDDEDDDDDEGGQGDSGGQQVVVRPEPQRRLDFTDLLNQQNTNQWQTRTTPITSLTPPSRRRKRPPTESGLVEFQPKANTAENVSEQNLPYATPVNAEPAPGAVQAYPTADAQTVNEIRNIRDDFQELVQQGEITPGDAQDLENRVTEAIEQTNDEVVNSVIEEFTPEVSQTGYDRDFYDYFANEQRQDEIYGRRPAGFVQQNVDEIERRIERREEEKPKETYYQTRKKLSDLITDKKTGRKKAEYKEIKLNQSQEGLQKEIERLVQHEVTPLSTPARERKPSTGKRGREETDRTDSAKRAEYVNPYALVLPRTRAEKRKTDDEDDRSSKRLNVIEEDEKEDEYELPEGIQLAKRFVDLPVELQRYVKGYMDRDEFAPPTNEEIKEAKRRIEDGTDSMLHLGRKKRRLYNIINDLKKVQKAMTLDELMTYTPEQRAEMIRKAGGGQSYTDFLARRRGDSDAEGSGLSKSDKLKKIMHALIDVSL